MKIVILNDLHFGEKQNADYFLKYQEQFFDTVLFPYIDNNNINDIIIAGDVFHERKKIDINTLYESRRIFFDRVKDKAVHISLGNHDIYYNNRSDINSIKEYCSQYTNIRIYDKPEVVRFDNTRIKFIPWINSSNYNECINAIADHSSADILVGHFEIAGFKQNAGYEAKKGMSSGLFPKEYKWIWSGHYHTKSKKGNILYLGSQFEMTWIDSGEVKGFHVYDTETGTLEFIENPYRLHIKLFYNEGIEDVPELTDKIVNLYVTKKDENFDKFVDKINKISMIDLKIIEDFSNLRGESVIVGNLVHKDTKDVIVDYVDDIETELDKDILKDLMMNIYTDAMNELNA